MKPWWELWPERLDHELEELRKSGIEFRISEKSSESGMLALQLQADLNGKRYEFEARFPPFYPYTRFEVYAPHLALGRHQNPFQGNLCLIGRGSQNWDLNDTLAAFIRERVPLLLRVAEDVKGTAAATLEEPQAEPITAYYPYAPGSMALVDSSWTVDSNLSGGDLLFGVQELTDKSIHGAVLQVRDSNGRSIAEADPLIQKLYGVHQILGRWVRMSEPVLEQSPREFLDRVVTAHPALGTPKWASAGTHKLELVGVLFPEEITWRNFANAWVFAVRRSAERAGFRPGTYWETYFVRAGRAGRSDMTARIPELNSLSTKKVAVVGLGCIGAASALEFARSGVAELRLMDDDVVEPGTMVRWPLGLSVAGKSKVEALVDFVFKNYPYTQPKGWNCKFGMIPGLGGSHLSVFNDFLSGVDLVFDATAETGIHYLLSELAKECRLPYVCVSATPGAWGGRVVRFRPGVTKGCWICLQHLIQDGTTPIPSTSEHGEFQPEGCESPTFFGPYFDVGDLPLAAVRLAVSTLCRGEASGYPEFAWDLAVLDLRTREGLPVAPTWKTFAIDRHPKCTNH
jgi:hypothetical protein